MPEALDRRQAAVKRGFDIGVATVVLLLTWPLVLAGWVVATVETRANGLFSQRRVGRGGTTFHVLKLRTMRVGSARQTTVTRSGDSRITASGRILRRVKLDELPQLVNVLAGQMSLVGPRPDVPGFADLLTGEDRLMLEVRPGITGPAALAYRHEEELLARVRDPETYNREVIWPDKVRINCDYVRDWSLAGDLGYLLATLATVFARAEPADAREESVRG